jgi:transposase-like protein
VIVGSSTRPISKVAGRWVYLYRAIDQFGQVIDVLVSQKRDLAATRRFFTRAFEHVYGAKTRCIALVRCFLARLGGSPGTR